MEYEQMKYNSEGLIPTIIQDYDTKEVLILAYMNKESIRLTIDTGFTWFYSRSRQELWNKGAVSGNTQRVVSIEYDCDRDTLLIKVKQKGTACHTGNISCFYNELFNSNVICHDNDIKQGSYEGIGGVLDGLYSIVAKRKATPKENSYTNYLFSKGIDKILKKVGEEAAETIIAAKNNDAVELISELSDLFYHLTVLMVQENITYKDIAWELAKRSKSNEEE